VSEPLVLRIRIRSLAVVLAATALTLLLAEGATRVLTAAGALSTEATLATGDGESFLYDPVLGWRNAPGDRETREITPVHVHVNASGFRGPEFSETKAPGAVRILVLGDSLTWGWGVGDGEPYPAVLRTLLARDASGPPPEVINAGTPGYGTDQELLLLERWGKRLAPDVVVLLAYQNDVGDNASSFNYLAPKPFFRLDGDRLVLANVPVPRFVGSREDPYALRPRPLLHRSALYRALLTRAQTRLGAARVLSALGLADLDAAWSYIERSQVSDAKTARLIAAVRDEAAALGAAFILMYAPEGGWPGGALPAFVTGIGVPVLDIATEFRTAGLPIGDVFLADRIHYSAAAHRVIAESLANKLTRDGLIRRRSP
jgi:lysophospholipase L1-like esterase